MKQVIKRRFVPAHRAAFYRMNPNALNPMPWSDGCEFPNLGGYDSVRAMVRHCKKLARKGDAVRVFPRGIVHTEWSKASDGLAVQMLIYAAAD